MGGSIVPEVQSCACGGRFIKLKERSGEYWACDKCDKEPTSFRLRKYLPGVAGKRGKRVEIRYDQNQKRLKDLDTVRATKKLIEIELERGTFDQSKYLKKESAELTNFANFVTEIYLPHYEKLLESGDISPYSMKAKRQYLRNYLLPYFTGVKQVKIKKARITRPKLRGKGKRPDEFTTEPVSWAGSVRDIREIRKLHITQMHASLPCSGRMKTLVEQELKTILYFAKDEAEVISTVPGFPKTEKAGLMDVQTFLTHKEFHEVLSHIDEPYKTMVELLHFYAMRPCEVVVLKWEDIDYRNNLLHIRRHTTLNRNVAEGRKSMTGACHSLYLDPKAREILQRIPRPIKPEGYIFSTEKTEFMAPKNLSTIWREAMRKTRFKYVDLYRGTKSSRLTSMLRAGCTMEQIREVTGHTNLGTLARYAQLLPSDRHKNQSRAFSMAEEA